MNRYFSLSLSMMFVIIGLSLITNNDWSFPQGDFTFKNYVGFTVILFFSSLFLIGLAKLFSEISGKLSVKQQ